ncbi:AbrB/MazE/SpoVT family DNA-binding domain-containing protein [Luteolibacter flavescens]|uniref:AbrB/MazE/SpoVT family DNA-binding domain-containing protein n=1 Tax=Luteolibacter flavescens TaxID=1859460 RepID=A0ABT3FMF5_9BACT|nr:AbrB/MazE/SpoVT family DNA-binding domain-containing protein [Luteolibacter flavescens]MCW1884754.1 AbrB/MazE/SpoVT family DNA-binding domain-containing protein [Luteolibacter flavescens]
MKATLTVDKAGRIILPKPIRDLMHLSAGSKLEAEIVGGRLQITPEEEEDPPFKMVDGVMVILGGGPTPGGLEKAVRDERDAMIHRGNRTP